MTFPPGERPGGRTEHDMTKGLKTPALAEGADREHCVSVRGGKVHEVTEWDDQGPEYVFPLCRTGSMTNSGTKYRKTTADLSCTNCVANRERRRARQAEEAAAAQAPAVEEAPAPAVTAADPITVDQARGLADRVHGRTDEFETLQGEGGRLLGWTFRSGRLHGARYGWVTAAGTVAKGLEAYRSYAGDVLVHADRDDREAAGRPVETGCVHDRYPRTDVQGDPVLACSMTAEGDTFGVFDCEGERYDVHPCAVQAANDAARSGGWDEYEGSDPQPYWAKLCPAHPFEVAGRCSSCGQDTPDEDAEGAADSTYAHLRTEDVAEAVRMVHADAHSFQRFDSPVGAVRVTGWTFRTGHGAGARYGVVTAAGQVSGVGLYEYRTTAERAYLNGYGQEDTGRS